MSSIGNVPCVYMTAFDGWAYDQWHGAGMLNAEAGISIVSLGIALTVLWQISGERRMERRSDRQSVGA
jgi:hypothetical protein